MKAENRKVFYFDFLTCGGLVRVGLFLSEAHTEKSANKIFNDIVASRILNALEVEV